MSLRCIEVTGEDLHLFSLSNDSTETNLVGRRLKAQAISHGSLSDETHSVEQPSRAELSTRLLLTQLFFSYSSIRSSDGICLREKPTKTWQTGAFCFPATFSIYLGERVGGGRIRNFYNYCSVWIQLINDNIAISVVFS